MTVVLCERRDWGSNPGTAEAIYGLASRCITALPSLQAEGGGVEPLPCERQPVFKTGAGTNPGCTLRERVRGPRGPRYCARIGELRLPRDRTLAEASA
jgi:hypothetical protein